MGRIAYVNGRYVPLHRGAVAVEDRGYQFADGVYEVVKTVGGGPPLDLERHFRRLERSLGAIRLEPPMSRGAMLAVMRELVRRNGLSDAKIYIQITRGTAPRDQAFPARTRPSVVMTVRRAAWPSDEQRERGVAVMTASDLRWRRCDIKSTSLLANCLHRQEAVERGCREAWLYDDRGYVTEGSSSNAWIVDDGDRPLTHPTDHRILGGVTRDVVLELARGEGIEVAERPFSLDEARRAREAFLTSTTSWVLPVTTIDGTPVGDGRPGPVTRRLMRLYSDHVYAAVGQGGRPTAVAA
jgi:D-alanine transaminase